MIAYETARLAVLRQLNLLDTPASESFDRITRMASRLFNLPIAAVSLTDEDRQWFKSRVGVEHLEIPRFKACCGEVADTSDVLVINDLLASERYQNSILADSGIRFYAGAPLLTKDGYTLGAMCVLGTEPRQATTEEIAVLKDLAAMVMAQIDLQHAVGRIDSSTGLPNYNQFLEDLEDLCRDNPGATYYALSTELVDMSQASSLQRVMGPSYLEDLARAASEYLRQSVDGTTPIYHIGPCQFAHLCTGGEEQVLAQAKYLQAALLTLKVGDASPFMLRPVIGIAPFVLGETKPTTVLRLAHSASRDAREAEQNVGLYSLESDATHQRRYDLVTNFSQALQAGEGLHLVYQPRVHVATGKCVGGEALLRWQHPALGNIPPGEFIPLVENTSMARGLTDWVLRNAIRQSAQWRSRGFDLRISINVAASNLEEEDFAERLWRHLQREDLPLNAIELELTESGLIRNGRTARMQLQALVEAGVTIAIDDFGTGYSSLDYLQKIPAHIVKIDRSFVDGLEDNKRAQTLVKSMISMAHDLGYTVVAEGVETWACYDLLESLGCDEVQGYLLAKPLSSGTFASWLLRLQRDGLKPGV